MEKRFLSFLLASMAIMIGYGYLQIALLGPRAQQDVAEGDQPADAPVAAAPTATDGKADSGSSASAVPTDRSDDVGDMSDAVTPSEEDHRSSTVPAAELPRQRITVGSLDRNSRYKMLVYLDNKGAVIERIELNDPRYQDIENKSGYLGYLSLADDPAGGCRVGVVGPGTPAALATALNIAEAGLKGPEYKVDDDGNVALQTVGDRILEIDGDPVRNSQVFRDRLGKTRPGQPIELSVERTGQDGKPARLRFRTTLAKRPLAIMRIDPDSDMPDDNEPHAASFLMTLSHVGEKQIEFGNDELVGMPSLHRGNWQVTQLPPAGKQGPGVEFRRRLTATDLQSLGVEGVVDVVKRFRLATIDLEEDDGHGADGYQLQLEVELQNLGTSPVVLGYQLDGPTGLPLEGWWYSSKVHPSRFFKAAGARDVIWRPQGQKHQLAVCGEVTDYAEEDEENPNKPLLSSEDPVAVRYIGCDAQYFSAVLIPQNNDGQNTGTDSNFMVEAAFARPTGPLDTERKKRTDVTFRFRSVPKTLLAGEKLSDRYVVFAGPKHPEVLAQYNLEDCIIYGWFGRISKPLVGLLHIFYMIVRNYGLAIIVLTVLVRGCMFPLGRKMAMNAQKMQMLAPEMKKIAEKYKNDLEKRSQAQRELFAKHQYNPFAGCLLMFFQLPIFIGLYRGLSVDIELRQAPLIPGLSWCSNLAGPDQLLHWSAWLPGMLSDKTGWLGPYLNILPVITVVLFIVHQKLFTPPPTDDQQRMQHQMMKFMMLFMGVLFHKVASGLCVYFIASSMWGLAERLLLPKPQLAGSPSSGAAPGAGDKPEGSKSLLGGLFQTKNEKNGRSSPAAKRRKKARKKR